MCPFRGAKAPPAVHFTGVLPAVDLSDGGPFTASRDSCPGADAKFFTGFWVKNFVGCSFTLDSQCGRLWLYQPQATGTHTGVWHRQAMSRDPPQRRRARARNGVAPYIPAAFCRDAGSAGHGATRVARPERSLQARGFHASDRSDSPKPRQRVRRRLAGAPAAACRSRA